MKKHRVVVKTTPNVLSLKGAQGAAPKAVAEDHRAVVEFVAGDSFLSRLIGGGWREFWSHMTQHVAPGLVIDARSEAIFAPDEWCVDFLPPEKWVRTDGGWLVPPGVQYRPAAYLADNAYSLKLAIPCTHQQHKKWVASLKGQIGEPYDLPGLIARSLGKTTDPAWRGKHHPFFCNALGIWSLQTAKLVPPLMEAPFGRAPGAACDVCMAVLGSYPVSCRGKIVEDMMAMAGFDVATLKEAV